MWVLVESLVDGSTKTFGPFPTRQAAEVWEDRSFDASPGSRAAIVPVWRPDGITTEANTGEVVETIARVVHSGRHRWGSAPTCGPCRDDAEVIYKIATAG